MSRDRVVCLRCTERYAPERDGICTRCLGGHPVSPVLVWEPREHEDSQFGSIVGTEMSEAMTSASASGSPPVVDSAVPRGRSTDGLGIVGYDRGLMAQARLQKCPVVNGEESRDSYHDRVSTGEGEGSSRDPDHKISETEEEQDARLTKEIRAKNRHDGKTLYRKNITDLMGFGMTREEAVAKLDNHDLWYGEDWASIVDSEKAEYDQDHPRPYHKYGGCGSSPKSNRSGSGGGRGKRKWLHPFWRQSSPTG